MDTRWHHPACGVGFAPCCRTPNDGNPTLMRGFVARAAQHGLEVKFLAGGGHPVLLAQRNGYPTLLHNDFLFRCAPPALGCSGTLPLCRRAVHILPANVRSEPHARCCNPTLWHTHSCSLRSLGRFPAVHTDLPRSWPVCMREALAGSTGAAPAALVRKGPCTRLLQAPHPPAMH